MFRDRRFVTLLGAAIISSTGSNMTLVALPWFVLATTGSAAKMGLVFAVRLLPVALFGFASSRIVDRIGAGRTLVVADVSRAVFIGAIPLLYQLGMLSFAVLVVLAFVLGLFGVPYYASQRLVLAEIFEDDERAVAQGNSLLEGVTEITTLVGPAIAGVLIALVGTANVLWVDAGTYALSAALLAIGVSNRDVSGETEPVEPQRALAGVRYLRTDRVLGPIALSSLFFGFSGAALIAALPYVAFARYDQDPRIAGWLLGAFGGGAILGALSTYLLLRRLTALQVARLGVTGLVISFWIVAVPMPAWTLAFMLILMGFWNPLTNTVIALFTTRPAPSLRAPVMTSLITINGLAAPVGYAVAGLLLEGAGFAPTIILMATVGSIGAALFLAGSVRQQHPAAAISSRGLA